jgi:hypothetical protein
MLKHAAVVTLRGTFAEPPIEGLRRYLFVRWCQTSFDIPRNHDLSHRVPVFVPNTSALRHRPIMSLSQRDFVDDIKSHIPATVGIAAGIVVVIVVVITISYCCCCRGDPNTSSGDDFDDRQEDDNRDIPLNRPAQATNQSNDAQNWASPSDKVQDSDDGSDNRDDGKATDRFDPVSKLWPKRLLHVATMTSYPRKTVGGRIAYNRIVEPDYNIMSYTWGRWSPQGFKGPTITVHGCTWNIPAVDSRPNLSDPSRNLDKGGFSVRGEKDRTVDPGGFTVEDFQNAIQVVGTDVEFIWLDVACIDQDNAAERDEEVGRQAGIFRRAQQSYIWLHNTSTQDLSNAINTIVEFDPRDNEDRGMSYNSMTAERILFSDRWFSSLWTLQEAYLSPRALFLSRAGELIQTNSGRRPTPITLSQLASKCRALYRVPSRQFSNQNSPLQLSGLPQLHSANRMVLITLASQRTISDSTQRINGIMQVYNLKLGASATPKQRPDLPAMATQLSAELNQRSPVLAQCFIHRAAADNPGRAWQVTLNAVQRNAPVVGRPRHPEDTTRYFADARETTRDQSQIVPWAFEDVQELPSSQTCHFTYDADRQRALYSGWETTLLDVVGAWRGWSGNCLGSSIYLDVCDVSTGLMGMETEQTRLKKVIPTMLAQSLREVFKQPGKQGNIKVLVLGRLGHVKDNGTKAYVGVIVVRRVLNQYPGEEFWCRVGFCSWGPRLNSSPFQCTLGIGPDDN